MSADTLNFIDRSGFGFLICGLLSIGIGVVTYNDFFKCDYIQIRNHSEWTVPAGYSVPQFVALVIGTFMLPLGIVLLLVFAVQSSKNKWNDFLKMATYAGLFMLSCLGIFLSYDMAEDVLSCGIFCMGSEATQNEINDAGIIFMGLIYFFVCIGFALLFLYLSVLSMHQRSEYDPPPTYLSQTDEHESKPLLQANHSGARPLFVGRQKHLTVTVVVLTFAVLYPLLFFACTALPTWWSYFSHFSIQEYQVK